MVKWLNLQWVYFLYIHRVLLFAYSNYGDYGIFSVYILLGSMAMICYFSVYIFSSLHIKLVYFILP